VPIDYRRKGRRKVGFKDVQKVSHAWRPLGYVNLDYTLETNPGFRYEDKTGEERNLVIFEDAFMNNHINGELSKRPFH